MQTQHEVVRTIVDQLESQPNIEGAFLSGSLANENEDQFSDIDLGIASQNSSEAFEEIYALRHHLVNVVGQPVNFIERGWEHCKMIAVLYGKSQFPPIALEVDLVFSQLKYVSEQMPYAIYKVVFDRSGKLKQELDKISRKRPKHEIEQEIKQHLRSYLFCVHDAVKACERGDSFNMQSLLEEMRKRLFFVAAIRQGEQVYGTKRAYKYLSAIERQIVEDSYSQFTREIIEKLTELYVLCLEELQSFYQVEHDIKRFQDSLSELL